MTSNQIISTLLATTVTLGGVAYKNVTSRIDGLESDKKALEQTAQQSAVTTERVKNDLEWMKRQINDISVTVKGLNEGQQEVLRQTGALFSILSRNRQDYQKSLNEWYAANESATKRGRK